METHLPYIFRVGLSLMVFYLVYRLFFQKEKMFAFNRFYLIGTIAASFMIPLLTFSVQVVIPSPDNMTIQSLPMVYPSPVQVIPNTTDWGQVLEWVFFAGLLVLAARVIMGHIKVWRVVKRAEPKTIYHTPVWVTTEDVPPFTYFNKLIIPATILHSEHLQTVVFHEKIHAQERHCLDLYLAEISCLLQWFNPFAWLLRRAIRYNLEFFTDDKVIHQINQQEYQLGMVSLAGKTILSAFPTISNQSQLKKRIMMMKQTKSTPFRWVKVLVLIPTLTMLTLALSGRETHMVSPDLSIKRVARDSAINAEKTNTAYLLYLLKDNKSTALQRVDSVEPILIKKNEKTPLYIVDGEVSSLNAVGAIDIENISNVTELKNEVATKLYGEKGRNGVVVIDTKQVKKIR